MPYLAYMAPHPGCTAWMITHPNGERYLELWDKDATIADVLKNMPREQGTTAQRIDVGTFKIEKVINSYSGDSRIVNTEGWIGVLNDPPNKEFIAPGFENKEE